RVRGNRHRPDVVEDIEAIARRCAALPILDPRSPDEILGYDEHGLAT
ncbi:MAG: type II toxin-antitoxin system VapB family antitoxin, partial [Actinomycetota bacterium]|nr:type II toxin-antitoxin system VapB family antitoxin [Actinomycetota bacterium]